MNNKLNRILLSPDDASGAVEVDPLSQAAKDIDTSFPVLMGDRILRMTIVAATKAATKEHADRESLTLKMKTAKDATLSDGKTAKAGFTCYKRVGLSETAAEGDKNARTFKEINRDLALVLKAVGMADKSPRDLVNNPSIIDGQVVDVRVGISPARGSFPESNTFTFVLPA